MESGVAVVRRRRRHGKVTLDDVLHAVERGYAQPAAVPGNTFGFSSCGLPPMPPPQAATSAPPGGPAFPTPIRAHPAPTGATATTPALRSGGSVDAPPGAAPNPFAADPLERVFARSALNARNVPGDLSTPVWSTFSVSGVTPAEPSYTVINDSDRGSHMTVTFASLTPPLTFETFTPAGLARVHIPGGFRDVSRAEGLAVLAGAAPAMPVSPPQLEPPSTRYVPATASQKMVLPATRTPSTAPPQAAGAPASSTVASGSQPRRKAKNWFLRHDEGSTHAVPNPADGRSSAVVIEPTEQEGVTAGGSGKRAASTALDIPPSSDVRHRRPSASTV